MSLLYDDRFRPLTSTIGFIRAPVDAVAGAYVEWMTPIQAKRHVVLKRDDHTGPLDFLLQRLLPLTSVERRRFLFVPTTSAWTAFFDNGRLGTDAFSTLSYLSKKLGTRSCAVTVLRGSSTTSQASGEFDALTMEIYEPVDTYFLNYGRTLSLAKDDGKLAFIERGDPFPFEQLSLYQAPNIKERFTFDLLASYLRQLDIDAFNSDFYQATSECPAVLVKKDGPAAPKLQEFSLISAQKGK